MRKLATAAIAFSVAVVVSHYLVPPNLYLLLAAAFAVLSLSAIFCKGDIRIRLLLITLAAALGFSISYYSYLTKTVPARNVSETVLKVTARVTDYPNVYEDYTSVPIHLTGSNVPNLNALLYSYDTKLPALSPGDIISADVKLKVSDERYGEAFSGKTAEDVYLLCYVKSDIEITGKSPLAPILYFPKSIAQSLNEVAVRVFSSKASAFMTALLTGDTSLIYTDNSLYADMAEAGIMHIVAVSGMNVAFLVGFIQIVIRRKRLASFIGIPMVCLFVPFAGATASVFRAAFMQIMILSAPLIRRESDSVTSLSASLAILLLINPNACASVGLQLTFAATLGIVLVSPKIYNSLVSGILSRHKKKKKTLQNKATYKLLDGICVTFASTIGAILFSTPVTVLYFGYVSIIGILVNILVFWTVSVCFILGYISCFLGMLWLPLGTVPGALTSLLVRYIIAVAKLAAAVPYAAVYTKGNIFGYWVILVYIIFILCYVFRRKEGFRPTIPVCLAVCSLFIVILATDYSVQTDSGSFTAADVGQGQCLILTSGKATAIIDCGGNGTTTNAGDTVAGLLLGSGRQTIDVLALTHFDDDHCNGVIRLMSRVNVRRLVIPNAAADKTEKAKILSMAAKCGTQVYIMQDDTKIAAGDLIIDVYPTVSQNEKALIFLGYIGAFDMFISGDANESVEDEFLAAHTLPQTELYVAGHHGSKYSSGEELLNALHAQYAVISSGYNTYGHPAPETLARLKNAGIQIFRTDKLGNICFKING